MSATTAAPAKKATKTSKPKVTASHPPVIDMVKAAITAAKDRKGSSLAVVKKFITANYKVDVAKLGPHIRRCIAHAVDNGVLVRVGNKGKGASGSFKVADKKSTEAKPKAVKKPKVKKPKKTTTPKKPKVKPAAKKIKTPKKAAAKKPKTPKKAPAKKAKTAKKPAAKKTPKKK